MNFELPCNKHFLAYQNLGATFKDVTLEVEENCGGNTQVRVLDSKNAPVLNAIVDSPGGVITLLVKPYEHIDVFCDGGSDLHGCKVSVIVT